MGSGSSVEQHRGTQSTDEQWYEALLSTAERERRHSRLAGPMRLRSPACPCLADSQSVKSVRNVELTIVQVVLAAAASIAVAFSALLACRLQAAAGLLSGWHTIRMVAVCDQQRTGSSVSMNTIHADNGITLYERT